MGECDCCYQEIDVPYHIDEDIICESCYFKMLDYDEDEDESIDDEDWDEMKLFDPNLED